MKAVIVMSSAVTKYNRMDADFFCGQAAKAAARRKIESAEMSVKRAEARLRAAKSAAARDAQRQQEMIEKGEVIPI